MAQQIPGGRSGQAGEPLSWLPLIVSALVVAHIVALAYWVYRLASEKTEQRRKVQ